MTPSLRRVMKQNKKVSSNWGGWPTCNINRPKKCQVMSWHHLKHLGCKTWENTFLVIFLQREWISNYLQAFFRCAHTYMEYMYNLSVSTQYKHTHTHNAHTSIYLFYVSQLTLHFSFSEVSLAVIILSTCLTYLKTSHQVLFPNCIFFSDKMKIIIIVSAT